uniref:Uncharacterized protein n=1 Tax=Eutreptiella gymnastica TaxID=73025 RepID=A0A7S1JGF8_9EUGL
MFDGGAVSVCSLKPAVAGTIWPVGEVAQVRLEMFDSGAITVCSLKLDDECAMVGTIGSIGDVAKVRLDMFDCGDVSVCSVKLDDESAMVGTIGSIGDVAQVRLEMLDCGDVSVCSVKPCKVEVLPTVTCNSIEVSLHNPWGGILGRLLQLARDRQERNIVRKKKLDSKIK